MLRIPFLLILSSVFIFNTSAQTLPQQWLRSFQAQGKVADRIAAVTTDATGNVYVAGYAGNHHGAPDAFAMKRNPQGDTLWTYYYDSGNNNEDYATAILVDNAGNVYITGNSYNTIAIAECFTVKLLPSGGQAWATRYSPGGNMQSYGNALAVDASGNVYTAGYADPLSGSTDWLVIKYNASGVQQWVDVLNGPGNGDDEAIGIAIAPNGNPTVCGSVYAVNASGNINAFVKQYTPANGTAWTGTWTNPTMNGVDKFWGLGFTTSGDLLVGGETMNVTSSNRESFAIRYDATGNQQWAHVYTDATSGSDEYIRGVKVDDAGNVYFTGTDYIRGYVTKINSNGTNGWRKTWNGTMPAGYDIFHGVTVDDAGNVYAAGRGVYPGVDYYANGGRPNMIITKYNANGDSLWTYRCADSLNSSMGFAVTYRNGIVYAGGFVTDTAYVDENLFTLIVDTSGNAVNEWSYNGRGDAITMGQFVQTDAANNVYCAATIDRLYNQGYDVAIVKYNPTGTLLWERYYSSLGWNNDTLTAMQLDPAGNLILSISTDSLLVTSKYQLSLLKIDQNGNFLDTTWYSLPGSTLTKAMAIRSDGSVVMVANSSINGGIIVSFDAGLNGVWNEKIDTTQFALTRANCIDLFPNGDLVAGGFSQTATEKMGLIHRYDAAGNKLWSSIIDSVSAYDEVRDVSVSTSGSVAFTGGSGGNTTYATIVGVLNGTTGNQLWHTIYNPNTNYEYGVKVRSTPAGNIAFISRGWTGSVARYYTAQYSGTGTFQWANTYSSTASDREPVDLIVDPNNRVVTAGWAINNFSINYDYVLAGYSATGTVEFINTFTNNSPVSSSFDKLNDLTRDTQGDFIVTGQSSQEFYNNFLFKMVTIKYGGSGVGIDEVNSGTKSLAYVYPNPSADGKFTLLDASPNPIISGRIYDVQGKFIKEMNLETDQVDLTNCKAGLYVLVLQRNNAAPQQLRLIKN